MGWRNGNATGSGAGWRLLAAAQKSRASSSISFPLRGLVLFCFRFARFGLFGRRFCEASKKVRLKFESAVILNFDRNSESEHIFERIMGIVIRNE